MFVYSAVHICLNISLAAFWLFALLARTISPSFYSNLLPNAFSTEWVVGNKPHVGRRENPESEFRPVYALGICESLTVNIVHQKRKKYINSYNSPMIEANSSGAELPKAMKVAPATSD